MNLAENAFDEAWLEWLTRCYGDVLATMTDDQKWQLEAAFYAGAAFAGRVTRDHDHEVVLEAIKAHLERKARSVGGIFCRRCEKYFRREVLVDGEACPACRLVL